MTPRKKAEQFIGQMRAIREGLGITQVELARRIRKTSGYICDTERGRRMPNLTTVFEIAEGLGVEVVFSPAQKSK